MVALHRTVTLSGTHADGCPVLLCCLMQMSPFLGPLDKDLVKTLIKLLKSPAFLGTAQLLAAVASTDAELRTPVGLLKVWGPSLAVVVVVVVEVSAAATCGVQLAV